MILLLFPDCFFICRAMDAQRRPADNIKSGKSLLMISDNLRLTDFIWKQFLAKFGRNIVLLYVMDLLMMLVDLLERKLEMASICLKLLMRSSLRTQMFFLSAGIVVFLGSWGYSALRVVISYWWVVVIICCIIICWVLRLNWRLLILWWSVVTVIIIGIIIWVILRCWNVGWRNRLRVVWLVCCGWVVSEIGLIGISAGDWA